METELILMTLLSFCLFRNAVPVRSTVVLKRKRR